MYFNINISNAFYFYLVVINTTQFWNRKKYSKILPSFIKIYITPRFFSIYSDITSVFILSNFHIIIGNPFKPQAFGSLYFSPPQLFTPTRYTPDLFLLLVMQSFLNLSLRHLLCINPISYFPPHWDPVCWFYLFQTVSHPLMFFLHYLA